MMRAVVEMKVVSRDYFSPAFRPSTSTSTKIVPFVRQQHLFRSFSPPFSVRDTIIRLSSLLLYHIMLCLPRLRCHTYHHVDRTLFLQILLNNDTLHILLIVRSEVIN